MQWNMEAMSNYVDFNSIIVKVGRKSTHKLIRNSFDCDNSMSHRQFRYEYRFGLSLASMSNVGIYLSNHITGPSCFGVCIENAQKKRDNSM